MFRIYTIEADDRRGPMLASSPYVDIIVHCAYALAEKKRHMGKALLITEDNDGNGKELEYRRYSLGVKTVESIKIEYRENDEWVT